MIRRTGIVRKIGISLRIRIANALNISGGKAERLVAVTDGRCVREWNGVLSRVRMGSRSVGVFAHDDETRSDLQRRYDVGVRNTWNIEQLLRGMSGARLRRVCHEANFLRSQRRGSRLKE
jgi:hypothetical protein